MFVRYATVLLLTCAMLASSAAAVAQEKIDAAALEKIREEGLKRSQVMELLSYMTDVHGPRLTNSPNLKAASLWAKEKLASWGLANARLESFGEFGRGWSLEKFSASMVRPQYSPLIAFPKAWTPSTAGTVRGPVVYLDAGSEADLAKYKGRLKGAIVLIAPPVEIKARFEPLATRASDERLLGLANAEPPVENGQRFRMTDEQRAAARLLALKWQMVYEEGAALVLEPTGRNGDGGTIFVGAATMPNPPDAPFDQQKRPWHKDAQAIPQLVVASEHYNRMIRLLAKNQPVEVEVDLKTRFHDEDLNGYNVIAEIPGTDLKDEVVMLGAHYDSWHAGTGATDNAVGSAVMMEAIRIIQAAGLKPRRTIRIALWSGEEQGLIGSRRYVEANFGKRGQGTPPQVELKPAHEKISAYYNLDNGTGRIRGVYMQGNEAVRPIFRAWLAPFKDLGAGTLTISNTGGTDHLPFDGLSIPGFQFIQDPIEYSTRTHHTNMDVYDRIQEEDVKQAATIIAAFVYQTAVRDQKLPRKPLTGQP